MTDREPTIRQMAEQWADRLWEFADGGNVAGPRDFDYHFEQFGQAVAARTREACAQIAETKGCTSAGCWTSNGHESHGLCCPVGIAAAIRASTAKETR